MLIKTLQELKKLKKKRDYYNNLVSNNLAKKRQKRAYKRALQATSKNNSIIPFGIDFVVSLESLRPRIDYFRYYLERELAEYLRVKRVIAGNKIKL